MTGTATRLTLAAAAALAACLTLVRVEAQPAEDFAQWEILKDPFPSTGGGGVMIHGYKPVVVGAVCKTPFYARTTAGEEFHSTVEFVAVAVQGGILCNEGKWRANDGGASGTTPFRVFIKDGVIRGSP